MQFPDLLLEVDAATAYSEALLGQPIEQHNSAADRIRISLLAVDTHGYTNPAMAIAKVVAFDLCPRLRDLAERKLYLARGFSVPDGLEAVTVRRVSLAAIERGWDELLRLAASIRSGRVCASLALQRFGSAAQGDPLHRAAEHLGRLLRTVFLCDCITIEDFRREIHTLLNPGCAASARRTSRTSSCAAR